MNNKLICPFCQQELEEDYLDVKLFGCENQNCKYSTHYDTVGTKNLWQELIRTRKALDVAVDEITKIKVAAESVGIGFFMTAAIFALEKIKTAMEQKEVK